MLLAVDSQWFPVSAVIPPNACTSPHHHSPKHILHAPGRRQLVMVLMLGQSSSTNTCCCYQQGPNMCSNQTRAEQLGKHTCHACQMLIPLPVPPAPLLVPPNPPPPAPTPGHMYTQAIKDSRGQHKQARFSRMHGSAHTPAIRTAWQAHSHSTPQHAPAQHTQHGPAWSTFLWHCKQAMCIFSTQAPHLTSLQHAVMHCWVSGVALCSDRMLQAFAVVPGGLCATPVLTHAVLLLLLHMQQAAVMPWHHASRGTLTHPGPRVPVL
jgi:hypothetical protein